jgi:XTP/dITP diphosphohydrolase
MSLVVVPIASADSDLLTLAEWDLLAGSERVLFEVPEHALLVRLTAAGVRAGVLDDEPEAERDGWALVAEPDSARVLELARAGARVTAGSASPPDDLTAAHAAPTLRRAAASLADLVAVMARLRSADGCPWDVEQTHRSLVVHLVEEVYEVVAAIETGNVGAELAEELGDVLLQVAFHARIAEGDGRFDVGRVADGLVTKLLGRHPHVFGDAEVTGATEVLHNWEAIKAAEKQRADPFEDIPEALPALLLAAKSQKRAAGLGFAGDDDEARERVAEAMARPGDEAVGQALFWLVVLARVRGVDPEGALRRATHSWRAGMARRAPSARRT